MGTIHLHLLQHDLSSAFQAELMSCYLVLQKTFDTHIKNILSISNKSGVKMNHGGTFDEGFSQQV